MNTENNLEIKKGIIVKPRGIEKRKSITGLIFTMPWILGLLIFYAYPLLSSIYYSFTSYSVLEPGEWIGLQNYRDLFNDKLFWKSIYNTGIFVLFSVPINIFIGVSVALLLNSKIKGLSFYRTIFFIPTLVPIIATAIVWRWLLNPQFGLLNAVLNGLGLASSPWLTDPAWSKPSLILIAMWGVGQPIVTYLAGLQDIPVDLYEASDMDGAKLYDKIRFVTIPLLTPVIFFNLVMGIINSLQIFALPYSLTNGQGIPADSLMFYVMYLYNNAFGYMKMGYASAIAWILFVVILTLTLVIFRSSNRWVHYQGK